MEKLYLGKSFTQKLDTAVVDVLFEEDQVYFQGVFLLQRKFLFFFKRKKIETCSYVIEKENFPAFLEELRKAVIKLYPQIKEKGL